MLSIVLLGTGNVALQLFEAFQASRFAKVVQIYGRNENALAHFTKTVETTTNAEEILEADLYLIAVTDQAIKEVSALLHDKKGLVAHTSGSVPLDVINAKRKGVFYPLQTFTKGKTLDFSTIPICVEAESEADYVLLENLGKSISANVQRISSEQRSTLHVAAVFANNFSNHLFQIAKEICEKNGVSFDVLHPLIAETVDKIRFLPPQEAQTGPARRDDVETMQRHLDHLDNSMHKKIYQILSESIRKSGWA